MSLISGRICLAALVLWSVGGIAYGQDYDHDHPATAFTPSNAELNKDLDRILDSEYNDPPPIAHAPHALQAPNAPEAPSDADNGRRVQLRIFGAYWRAQLTNLEFSNREGASGGDLVKIDDPWDTDLDQQPGGDDSDFEGFGGGVYRLTLDVGEHVAISGSFSHVRFSYDHTVGTNGLGSFSYGATTFANGDQLSTQIQLYTGDIDLILRPLNNRFITIDISLGARYVSWQTELTQNLAAAPAEEDRLEALVPAAGIGITLRPFSVLEIFASARYGALSYDVDENYRWNEIDGKWEKVDNLERDSETIQADVGITLILGETIGITVGYRYEYFELERVTDSSTTRFAGEAHGLYGGVVLQF